MGKRSAMVRLERDLYLTPASAVRPLLPWLAPGTVFAEPCAADGGLVRQLQAAGHRCAHAADVVPLAPGIAARDALDGGLGAALGAATHIITNPPWTRALLHAMIDAFARLRPTWLLFDADWVHTAQSRPFRAWLRIIVFTGRHRWMPGTTMDGKENASWHLFDPAGARCRFGWGA
jgi:hypothetical protein